MFKAFVFPGQGSQSVGMGKFFYDNFPVSKLIFEEANDALKQDLADIIFNGPEDQLTLTSNAQPALLTTSIAILRCLEQESGLQLAKLSQYVAGHSLGEYTALTASGYLSFADAVRLVRIRGAAMQDAVPVGVGAMAAVLGADDKKLSSLLSKITDEVCEIANDNCVGQIVISGTVAGVDRAMKMAGDAGFKAIKLQVSAAFHSSLMKSVEAVMSEAINSANFTPGTTPIVTNVDSQPTQDIEIIKASLVRQVCGSVKWRQTMEYFVNAGTSHIVEIGPGKVLSNLAKRTAGVTKINTIQTLDDIMAYIDLLAHIT